MKRREFLAASIPAIVGASAVRGQSASDGGPLLASPPVVQHPAAGGFTVTWQVRGPATGWVSWGTRPGELDRVARPGGPGLLDVSDLFLTCRVSGLPAGTREVYYQVHARPVVYENAYVIKRGPVASGPVRQLRLPAPDQATLKLAVVNDTHENGETLAALAVRLDHHQPDAVLWNGDTCNDFYADARLAEIVLGPGAAPGDPGGGGWASTRPLYFVPGNHDVRGPRARRLREALPPWPSDIDPEATAAAGGPPWCFAQRLGPLALVGLDTGEDKPDARDVFAGLAAFEPWRVAQRDWLRGALRRDAIASAPHLLICCHIPLRGGAGHDDGQGTEGYARYCGHGAACWLPTLRKAGCAAVISGHTHRHRVDAAAGDLPAQVVGGGPQPERATLTLVDADDRSLRITVEDLAGNRLHELQRDARHG